MKKYFLSFAILFTGFAAALLAIPLVSRAATLTITSSSITLDTQGQSVNALEVHLNFSPGEFSVKGVNDGGSIVNLWVAGPSFSNEKGTLDLAGIIPGGIVTGNGTVLKMELVPKNTGGSKGFSVVSARALLNDGKGSEATLSVANLSALQAGGISASSSAVGTPTLDTGAPDPFVPEVASDTNVFNGKFFVAFAATDQGSGIDHYEVAEVPQGTKAADITSWSAATSPYLLRDQSLSNDVYVKAIDRDGNFRVVKVASRAAEVMPSPAQPWAPFAYVLVILIVVVGLFYAWYKAWHKKRS